MKNVPTKYCLSIGLWLVMTACGDPSQFNELMTGEAIYVEEKPEMTTAPEMESSGKTVTYAGEETNEPADTAGTEENPVAGATQGSTKTTADSAPASQLFTDCDDSPEKAIVADLYQLPEGTDHLPDFNAAASLRTVCLSQLNITDRQFTEGFPGVENLYEWFGLSIRYQVNAPKNGFYEFTLRSDDGAILWIDDAKIIDNDGLHAVTEKKAKVYLEAGQHDFRVSYYQGPRWRIALELFWKVPGTSNKAYIPLSAISRPE